ncbi:MAG: DUF2786 domain-containing protein [Bacteroidales bacterium]|nr:DUF2786 domain-containing protein [Bacteroidales bacterium]
MDKNSNQYESIKNKLLKLQALAEKGYKGEAENAKRAIESLCAKYGITLEEILCEEQVKRYEFEIGRYSYMLTLFVHCHGVVTNSRELKYRQRSRSTIAVDLTPLQYAELCSLFEWHKANFLKDLQAMQKNIVEAYVNKHNLFAQRDDDEEAPDIELTPARLRHIQAILAMQGELGDNKYYKMLEAAK